MPDEIAYKVCAALHDRRDTIPGDMDSFTDIGRTGRETEATPIELPLHPGAIIRGLMGVPPRIGKRWGAAH